jgi:Histidine kinase
MKYRFVAGFLFSYISNYGSSSYIDNLKNFLNTNSAQITKAELLEERCFQYFTSSQYDSLTLEQTQLGKINLKNPRLAALSEFYLAQTFYSGDSIEFFRLSKNALIKATRANCRECIALNYLGLGSKYQKLQQYSKAVSNLKHGIETVEDEEGTRMILIKGMLYTTLSGSYHQLGKLSEALQFGLDAMRIAESLNNASLKQKVYANLSGVYGELASPNNKLGTDEDRIRYTSLAKKNMLGAYESSLLQSNKRLSGDAAYHLGLFYNEENSLDSSSLYLNTAIVIGQTTGYFELLSNAYNIKGINMAEINADTALLYFNRAIDFAKKAGLIRNEASATLSKAIILQMKGNAAEALRVADQGLKLGLQSERMVTVLNAYKILSELNEEAGNPEAAYNYYKKHITIKDSLVSKENYARIEELKTQYDVEIKDKEIKSLSQMAAIQKLEIRQRNVLVISLAIFIIMAGMGIWLFIRQRTLRQKQVILEVEQRLNRARMNPHFFFNALTSLQQHALRQTDGMAMASRLSQFSDVMRKTLESTYQEYITIEEEIAYLKQYLEIQKNRYPVSFEFEVSHGDDLELNEVLVPPMIVQPFIENSIEHGLAGVDWVGKISVRFEKKEEELYVEIMDNGKGLGEEKQQANEHISRATGIIKDRIYLLATKMKSKARFSVGANPEGKGVLVAIYLPLIYKQETTHMVIKS